MWVIGNGYVLDDLSHKYQAITIDHMTTYHNGHSDWLTTFLTSITISIKLIVCVHIRCPSRNVHGPLATCLDTLGDISDHQYLNKHYTCEGDTMLDSTARISKRLCWPLIHSSLILRACAVIVCTHIVQHEDTTRQITYIYDSSTFIPCLSTHHNFEQEN